MKYDQQGNLILDRKFGTYIPAKQVRIIRHNWGLGIKFPEVSPTYPITREQLAFIVSEKTC